MHKDEQLISRLGGPAKLAAALGFDRRPGGTQRVQNWRRRGIPAAIKLSRPDLFLVDERGRSLIESTTQEPANV